MQSTGHFRAEDKCMADLEKQKQHMRTLVKKAKQGKIQSLEGTCVDVKISSTTDKHV